MTAVVITHLGNEMVVLLGKDSCARLCSMPARCAALVAWVWAVAGMKPRPGETAASGASWSDGEPRWRWFVQSVPSVAEQWRAGKGQGGGQTSLYPIWELAGHDFATNFTRNMGILMLYCRRLFAVVAAIAVTITGIAHAASLRPVQAQKIDLGTVSGVAYYTLEEDGHRLVVTLKVLDTNTVFRFVATLVPEQRVTLSVPRNVGESAIEVHFISSWRGD